MRNRRQFLGLLCRGGILATLAVFTGSMFERWRTSPECTNDLACRSCKISDRCRLPEADRHRLEQAKRNISTPANGTTGK